MQKLPALSLIVIIGPPGAGKTTLADLLHDELSYTAHVGADHIKRFISEFREVESHNSVSRKVVNSMADEYLKNDISVILEQGMDAEEVTLLEKIASKNNAKFHLYKMNAGLQILEERTKERSLKLSKPIMSKESILKRLKKFEEIDYKSTRSFDSGVLSVREMADAILEDLEINK